MKNLNNKLALLGYQTIGQRIDTFCNKNYHHLQDWLIVSLIAGIITIAIII